MKLRDYKIIFGTFRMLDCDILNDITDNILGPKDKVLIDTGVSYNVDHILGRAKNLDKIDIMTKFGVDHLKNFDWYVTNHLRFLRKDVIKYGLVHFCEEGWQDLVRKMKEDSRIETVGVSNFNIEQLEEYFKEFGEYPAINEIEFSIRYHDTKLVKFCKKHKIRVIGYGVFGGIHACKQLIREYLVEQLLGFCLSNQVLPIIRTDSIYHFYTDYNALELERYKKLIPMKVTEGEYSYGLHAEIEDPRALNKFKYEVPKHALFVDYDYLYSAFTLDSRQVMRCVGKEVIGSNCNGTMFTSYLEVPREFMMITDYLVKEKYEMDENDTIIVSDDCLFNYTTGDLLSFVMIRNDGEFIKSGSCQALVLRKKENRGLKEKKD